MYRSGHWPGRGSAPAGRFRFARPAPVLPRGRGCRRRAFRRNDGSNCRDGNPETEPPDGCQGWRSGGRSARSAPRPRNRGCGHRCQRQAAGSAALQAGADQAKREVVDRLVAKIFQHAKRGRLTRPGRAGHENQALRPACLVVCLSSCPCHSCAPPCLEILQDGGREMTALDSRRTRRPSMPGDDHAGGNRLASTCERSTSTTRALGTTSAASKIDPARLDHAANGEGGAGDGCTIIIPNLDSIIRYKGTAMAISCRASADFPDPEGPRTRTPRPQGSRRPRGGSQACRNPPSQGQADDSAPSGGPSCRHRRWMFRPDHAAMRLDDLLGNRQPKASNGCRTARPAVPNRTA